MPFDPIEYTIGITRMEQALCAFNPQEIRIIFFLKGGLNLLYHYFRGIIKKKTIKVDLTFFSLN
jgi:hypothetical protein